MEGGGGGGVAEGRGGLGHRLSGSRRELRRLAGSQSPWNMLDGCPKTTVAIAIPNECIPLL